MIGSTVAAAGAHAVKWQGLVSKVIIPAVPSPFIAALVATAGTLANGTLAAGATTPLWVIVLCALAIAFGTYPGGWRVIRTLGKGLGR